MSLSENFRLKLTERDKVFLSAIAEQDGQASMSAVVRRLIQNEAQRRNLSAVSLNQSVITADAAGNSPVR